MTPTLGVELFNQFGEWFVEFDVHISHQKRKFKYLTLCYLYVKWMSVHIEFKGAPEERNKT